MKYINTFKTHSSYEEKLNGGVDISLPNISYCKDVKDIHYNPYNTVEFYVGEITGTTPQTVNIYTDATNHLDVTVSEGNKWYTCLLPKDKGLSKIDGGYTLNKVKIVVKANINTHDSSITPIIISSAIEASLKGSNTSNVTDMYSMFNGCSKLTSLDLSGFDTSNVNNMMGMFESCIKLTSLDLSNFNTSNVISMSSMFSNCSSLTSLDLRNFNTSNVTYMTYMFESCSGLTSLDLSNFNTSNVTDMGSMFYGCKGLTSLTLSNFKTSKVTDMGAMFRYCTNLKTLDLSGWVIIGDETDTSCMFCDCDSLKTIIMKDCSSETVGKIQNQLTADGITGFTIVTE